MGRMSVRSEDIHKRGSKYPADVMREAAANFVVTGSISEVSRLMGIPKSTVCEWKNKNDEWLALVEQLRNEKQDEIDAGYTRIIHQGIDVIEDRMVNGDVILDKNNELSRKPVSMKDAAWTTGVIFDKRQILRNQPTSISTSGNLDTLAKRLEELEIKQNAKVVSEQ